MSTALPNGLPRHLKLPSLFSMVAPEPRPLLRDLEVANRGESMRVFYTGPQLEFGELEVLTAALKGGTVLPASPPEGIQVAMEVDAYLKALRMHNVDGGEQMLRDMMSNLSQGSIAITKTNASMRVKLLVGYQFDIGRDDLDPSRQYCFLTVNRLVAELVLEHVHPDTNTGQLVLDIDGAIGGVALRARQAAAEAEKAADEVIDHAAARRPGQARG